MPNDVVRVAADCPLCDALWNLLDRAFTTDRQTDITANEVEHFLAGVCVWWVAQSLAQFDGKVEPLFTCLKNALQEHGIIVTAMADSRPGARPS